jgi:hypothetical protein
MDEMTAAYIAVVACLVNIETDNMYRIYNFLGYFMQLFANRRTKMTSTQVVLTLFY